MGGCVKQAVSDPAFWIYQTSFYSSAEAKTSTFQFSVVNRTGWEVSRRTGVSAAFGCPGSL